MFNGYNDAPLISYSEFDQEGEKKQDNVPKWSYGHSAGIQDHAQNRQTDYWPNKPNVIGITTPLHVSSKCNCSECYSSETNSYQGETTRNQTWLPRRVAVPVNGSNESCKLPGTHQWNGISLPNSESCMIESSVLSSQHVQDGRGKNSYHRPFQNAALPEFHQTGVITSLKTFPSPEGHVVLKNKDEISSNSTVQEMTFYGQNHSRQPGLCPPTYDLIRNLEKRLDNVSCDSNYCDLSEKYSNLNSYRHSNSVTSYPLDSHISPEVEPYLKAVPLNLNQNRVPSIGHRNLKDNIPKSCIDENLLRCNNGSRKVITSDAFQGGVVVGGDCGIGGGVGVERNERVAFQSSIAKEGMMADGLRGEQLHGLPSSMISEYKNNQIFVDYSHFSVNRDLPKPYENSAEVAEMQKKLLLEHDRQMDYFPRNNIPEVIKRNGQNSLQENKKDCIINQINQIHSPEQQYGNFNRLNSQNSNGSKYLDVSNSKASVPVFYPTDQNVDDVLKPDKCDLLPQNPALFQRNGQNLFKNQTMGVNARFTRPPLFVNDSQDFRFVDRRQNSFPYQNNATSCRNLVRPQYSYQDYTVSNVPQYPHSFNVNNFFRSDGNPVNHRTVPPRIPNCKPPNPSSFIPSGNNAFVINPYCHPPVNIEKSPTQPIFNGNQQLPPNSVQMYSDIQVRAEEPRIEISEPKGTNCIELIKSQTLNKNGNTKISPLRLLRKKKLNYPKNEIINKSPVHKGDSDMVPALDVRKFWSTWADEEEDNTSSTQMVVLDCQNINPEQAELLQLYENNSIHDLQLENNNMLSPKSSGCEKRSINMVPGLDISAKEINSNCNGISNENGVTIDGFDFRNNVTENHNVTDIIKGANNSKLESLNEKNAVAVTPDLLFDTSTKNQGMGDARDAVILQNVTEGNEERLRDKEVNGNIRIGETDFVEKVDFLKVAGLSKEADPLENDEPDKIKYDENEFSFNIDTISSKVKSSEDELRETETENNQTSMDKGSLPEKVEPLGRKHGEDMNDTKDEHEQALHRLSPLDDESLGNSPYNEKCDLPDLPTSEYRRNKFLNYSDRKFIVNGEIMSSAEANKIVKVDECSKGCSEKVVGSDMAEKITVNPVVSKGEVLNEKNMKQECPNKNSGTLLDKYPRDELGKVEFQYFKNESVINDYKPKEETGSQGFEMDNILQKLSKINVCSSEGKVKGVTNGSEIDIKSEKSKIPKETLSADKKLKKAQKMSNRSECFERMDKVTLENIPMSKPTIKFSIQKSHDLKISFKVLNNEVGSTKIDKSLSDDSRKRDDVDKYENSAEESKKNATDIKFRLKSVQTDDCARGTSSSPERRSHCSSSKKKNKLKLRRRKTTDDESYSLRRSFLRVKKNQYLTVEENDNECNKQENPLAAEAAKLGKNHLQNLKSENCFSRDEFQVKESIDSAKIKLTFKRQKGNNHASYEIENGSRKNFESEDPPKSNENPFSEGEKGFPGKKPGYAAYNLDPLSVDPTDVEFSSSETRDEGAICTENDSNSKTNDNPFDSFMSQKIPNWKSEDNGETSVEYSDSFSDPQFTHLRPHDKCDKNENEEKFILENFISEKPKEIEESSGRKCLKVSENVVRDVFGEPESSSNGPLSSQNENSLNDEIVGEKITKKCHTSWEESDYKSIILPYDSNDSNGDSVNSKTQSEFCSENINSEDILKEHSLEEGKNDSLKENEKLKHCDPSKNVEHPLLTITKDDSNTRNSWTNALDYNIDSEENPSKKINDVSHLLTNCQSNDRSVEPFKMQDWSNDKETKIERIICDEFKGSGNLDYDNSYSSSLFNFANINVRKKLEECTENGKVSRQIISETAGKNESLSWSEPFMKPTTVDPLINVDESIFGSDELLPASNKSERSNILEKRWLDSFNVEEHSSESDNNSFEFIINSSGKIVTSNYKKMHTREAQESAKIDEIDDALEAIFQEAEKNDKNVRDTTPKPGNQPEINSNIAEESGEEQSKICRSENSSRSVGDENGNSLCEGSKPDSEHSNSNILHDDVVKDQNETTDPKWDSVMSENEERTEVCNDDPNKKNDILKEDNCEKLEAFSANENSDLYEFQKLVKINQYHEGNTSFKADSKLVTHPETESLKELDSQDTKNDLPQDDVKTLTANQSKNISNLTQKLETNIPEATNDEDIKAKKDTLTVNTLFNESHKIKRRHSMVIENQRNEKCINFTKHCGGMNFTDNASKIKFTYSQWKSRYLKAKSCPPLEFLCFKDDLQTKTSNMSMDISVEDIPLPPGEAPSENCFDLIQYLKKRKLSQFEASNERHIEPTKTSKILKMELCDQSPHDEFTVAAENINYEEETSVQCVETNNNVYITKGKMPNVLDLNHSQSKRCESPQCSSSTIRVSEENETYLTNEKVTETRSIDKEKICDSNQDLFRKTKPEKSEVMNYERDCLHLVSSLEESVVFSPLIAENDSNMTKNCSNSKAHDIIKLEEYDSKSDDFEKKSLLGDLSLNQSTISDSGENLPENFCKNEDATAIEEPLKYNGEKNEHSEQAISSVENDFFQKSEELEDLHHEFEKNNVKSICDDIELVDAEATNSGDVDLLESESTGETSFQNNKLVRDGFYECEDIPTSEDLPNGNIEMEKVSDDAKFRHMMQNCLDNAKKFLNVSNLKLFPCSVDDLLELNCPQNVNSSEEKDAGESFNDSVNLIPRDVLLTSGEDVVSNDLDLNVSQKFPLSDLSLDFVTSFGPENSNNICPEVLPVDNWPYLEEEVPSSPAKANLDETDLISFLENPTNTTASSKKKSNSKIVSKDFDNVGDCGVSSMKNIEPKKVRRRSLYADDESYLKKHSKIGVKRRKTMDSCSHYTAEEVKNNFRIEVTESKNGLKEIQSFWNDTKSLKCRLNLDRLINNLNEKAMPKSSLTLDYTNPKWQPKVVLSRISKKQIKKYQRRSQMRNSMETRDEREISNHILNKESADERERISQDIVRVLESHDTFSKNLSDLEPSNSSSEQSSLGKSKQKKDQSITKSKIPKDHLLKKEDSNLRNSNATDPLKELNSKKNSSFEKTSNSLGEFHLTNYSSSNDSVKRKKSRFRNLHDKRKPDIRKNHSTDAQDLSTKCSISDAERRLSEIFKDCMDSTTERFSNREKSEILSSEENIKTLDSKSKKHSHYKVSDDTRKKHKSEIAENVSDTSNENRQHLKSESSKKESLYKSVRKHDQTHGEKLSTESSRHDKNDSYSSKHLKDSLRNHRDKSHSSKRDKNKNKTLLKQKGEHKEENCKIKVKEGDLNCAKVDSNTGCSKHQDRTQTTYLKRLPLEEDSEMNESEKPWVCEVCGFKNANERIGHIKGHPFHCQSCHLAFRTEAHFIDHLTEKHKDIRNQHHCLLCELSFNTEKEYQQHLETREHIHLDNVEKNTINTLFTLLTGQPCPVFGLVELRPEWLPNQAGTVHFYHQATPLSLALQYLKMHHDLSSYSKDSSSHSS